MRITVATGRLSSIGTIGPDNDPVYFANFDYFGNDQRQTETISKENADGSSDAYTASYIYDDLDQLTNVSSSGPGGPTTDGWNYDDAGNRLNFAGGANKLNQYANYTYDARGNCTFDGVFHYSYDAKDRLATVEAVDHSVRQVFQYDAEGRRIEKADYAWDSLASEGAGAWMRTPGNIVRFAYDGGNLIAEFDGANHLQRSYAWGPTGLLGVTDFTSGTPQIYLTVADGSGNVVSLTDASGTVVASYTYDPWGTITNAKGLAANVLPLLWGQGYRDSETGLIYLQNRFYSPMQGRFLNRDPIAESGGVNLYAYCGNDPVNKINPTASCPSRRGLLPSRLRPTPLQSRRVHPRSTMNPHSSLK